LRRLESSALSQVGTSLGARRGLLIRGGDVLERASRIDTVVFDKTTR
jgi:Cu2+-exporting ATPase